MHILRSGPSQCGANTGTRAQTGQGTNRRQTLVLGVVG